MDSGGQSNMNTTQSVLPMVTPKPFLLLSAPLSPEMTHTVNVFKATLSILSLLGVATNLTNIIIFKRQGIHDGVTLSLFTLAISDFAMCFLFACFIVMEVLLELDPGNILEPRSIQLGAFGYPRSSVYTYSTCITIYLSVERCLCVLMPFKFKLMFTKKKTAVLLVICSIFSIGSIVPMMLTQELRWQYDPRYQKMRVFLFPEKSGIKEKLRLASLALTSVFLPILAQVVISVCTILMINGLKKANKFREGVVTRTTNTTTPDDRQSAREKKVVRMVLTLSIIFLVCNFPFMMGALIQYSEPRFTFHGSGMFGDIFFIYYLIVYVFSSINGSVNLLVYYRDSSRFKEIFNEMFCLTKQKAVGLG